MVCYPVLMFLVSDEVDSYDIGWLLIGLILVNIAINVAIMMILTGLKIREKFRRRKTKIA
jgi:heme/copper-type cytochrome/quinol oxidase subunit 2